MKKTLKVLLASILIAILCTSCSLTERITGDGDSQNAESTKSTVSVQSEESSDAEEESDDGVVKSRFTQDYKYDDKGNISEVYVYDTDSELKATIEHTYDKNGTRTQLKLSDGQDNIQCVNKYEYKKDPKGASYISKDTYFDANEKIILYVEYEYSKESESVVLKGYFDADGKEITSEKANEMINDINSFMYE